MTCKENFPFFSHKPCDLYFLGKNLVGVYLQTKRKGIMKGLNLF